MEKFEIKIVRLKTGEDIIGFIFEDKQNNTVEIKYPKTFYSSFDSDIGYDEIIIVDWLPNAAYAYQETIVDRSDILFVAYATIQFGVEYLKDILLDVDPKLPVYKSIEQLVDQYNGEVDSYEENNSTNPLTIH